MALLRKNLNIKIYATEDDTDASGDVYVACRKFYVKRKQEASTTVLSPKVECLSRDVTFLQSDLPHTTENNVYGTMIKGVSHFNPATSSIDDEKRSISSHYLFG